METITQEEISAVTDAQKIASLLQEIDSLHERKEKLSFTISRYKTIYYNLNLLSSDELDELNPEYYSKEIAKALHYDAVRLYQQTVAKLTNSKFEIDDRINELRSEFRSLAR